MLDRWCVFCGERQATCSIETQADTITEDGKRIPIEVRCCNECKRKHDDR